jgi:hypothetical protein
VHACSSADQGAADVAARVAFDHRDHVVAALEGGVAVGDDDVAAAAYVLLV